MTTTIDNTQRVFLLTGDMGKKVFCNLADIPVEIYHFWNAPKIYRAGKKFLNDMFKASQMKFRLL